ncbi:glycoside hydrolase family 2 TIM barrel-domain containing protein [Candidatus Halobonum tyrrellensis]|uniref:beta-galactosidase n=1 Tax=Candidatus Halobonum tyrrellensis G22 TaxID=1324957 RepID=V4H8I4_9EURY|nr:glycoside hydrolase family 2 TIM barrel-domain containing protein [Candidatus Halobonum tyrrellensis]ESP87025.1 glycoside hydrolase family protein [Candidatus Halobonum tyrrellensis G22]
MTRNQRDSADGTNRAIETNRRRFLKAAGFGGLAGVTTASASRPAAAAPTTSDGPGAVSNLAAYIEEPTTFAENQEPPRVHTAVPFDSVTAAREANTPFTALESRLGESDRFRSLNGEWAFAFHPRPAAVPDSYASTDWDTITVPSCWQTEGYDEYVYRNTQLTWEGLDRATNTTPPQVPDDYNPVGTYRRTFSVPDDWDGRRTFVNFEGVKQAFFLWVDGEYVGYNQGSMTAAEFDLTDYVAAGSEHSLTVQVYRFSDGEALETQDMFRFSGIYRSVYLYSTPQVRLRDFFVRTDLDDDYEDATLRVDAELANYTGSAQGSHTVRGHLFDDDGAEVTTFEASATVGPDGATLSTSAPVSDPDTWTAETPTLYTLVLEHLAPGENGTGGSVSTAEAMFEPVGFREFSIADDQFRVNGQPVDIRGVNKHEHHPEHGRHVPLETVMEDFELMKSHNVNSFRCSHYPNDPSTYYLADEYGLYVQDEINVETHWNTNLLGETDAWDAQAFERFRRMVQSEKNRPSIFTWSTGNEAGLHDVHYEMAEYVTGEDEDGDGDAGKGVDPTRFLYHQDNADGFGGGFGGTAEYSPIAGPRYPAPDAMRAAIDADPEGEPIIMGEYAHAMGNSGGLFHDFWEWAQPDHRTVTETVFADASAAGNDGTVVGDPEILDEDDGAVAFDNDGYVDVGRNDSLDFDEPGFTVWARVADPATDDDDPYVARGDRQYALKIVPGDPEPQLQFFVYDRENSWQTLNVPVPDGWSEGYHDVAGVATDSTLRLFVDGELVGETAHDATTLKPEEYSYPLTVGYNAEANRYADATVSQARVYDRALSASEVASAAEATSPSDGAVLWLEFDEYGTREEFRRFEEYDRFQGGFVWDWVDQAVYRDRAGSDGEPAVERFYDGNPFCLNGVVFEDRTPQPSLQELKKSHQPVGVVPADLVAGTVTVTNHLDFANLDALDGSWELAADDEVVQSGSLSPDIAPGESAEVTVPFDRPDPEPGVDYWLTLRFTTTEDTRWADAGHQVAFEQMEVPFEVPEPSTVSVEGMAALSVDDAGDAVAVSGDGFEYAFDRERGTLSSATYGGTEVVADGPQLEFFRPPIQNEIQSWGAAESNEWYDVGLDDLEHEVESLEVERAGESVVHVAVESLVTGSGSDAGFRTEYRYKLFGSGDVLLGVDVEPTESLVDAISYWLPRVGVAMDVPDGLGQFSWYGRGPHETYPDRKWGAEVGVYEGTVDDQFVPYQPPSDNGNKADTRWAALSNDDGVGLASFGHPDVHVNLNGYDNLAEAEHVSELEPKEGVTTVHLDHAVTGVGGTPQPPLPQYQVQPEPMTFLVGLRPFGGAGDDGASPMELGKRRLPREWVDFGPTGYQVDFAAGEPIEELGEDGLYAEQDRLMRFAFGSADEGITEKDTAWPSAEIRDCLDYGHIREHDDGTASVTFTVADDCDEMTLSLVTYSMPGEEFSASTADEQELLGATTETFGPGEHTITVDLPGGTTE